MDHQHDYCPDYGDTVSSSRQESLIRALELLEAEAQGQKSRPIQRPEIRLGKMMLCNFVWLVLTAAVCAAAGLLQVPAKHQILLTMAFVLAATAINARRIIIDLVLIYQRYAPEKLRAACVFEPSCSQYMILAVEKYGAFRGAVKGIKRLLRCHPPHGGEDYP